eukprot:4028703-Prymnesium_polylepis.1
MAVSVHTAADEATPIVDLRKGAEEVLVGVATAAEARVAAKRAAGEAAEARAEVAKAAEAMEAVRVAAVREEEMAAADLVV